MGEPLAARLRGLVTSTGVADDLERKETAHQRYAAKTLESVVSGSELPQHPLLAIAQKVSAVLVKFYPGGIPDGGHGTSRERLCEWGIPEWAIDMIEEYCVEMASALDSGE